MRHPSSRYQLFRHHEIRLFFFLFYLLLLLWPLLAGPDSSLTLLYRYFYWLWGLLTLGLLFHGVRVIQPEKSALQQATEHPDIP